MVKSEKRSITKRRITGYMNARGDETLAEKRYGLASPSLDILAYLYYCDKWVPIESIRTEVEIAHRSSFTDRYMNPLARQKYVKLRLNQDHTRDAAIAYRGKRLAERIFS